MNESYAVKAQSRFGKYLFAYFIGNGEGEEKIRFAVSEDGYNFTPLNGNKAVIEQHKGKNVSVTHIFSRVKTDITI